MVSSEVDNLILLCDPQLLQFRSRVELGVMAMKEYSTFLKVPERESHDQIQLSIIPGESLECVLLLCRDAVGVFHTPSQLG